MVKLNLFTISLILIILAISLSIAEDYGRADTDVNLKKSVRVDGAITSTALCNITVFDPYKNTLVDFKSMTYNAASQTFNYTLPASNTSQIGDYTYDITCMANGLNETNSFIVTINPIGKAYTIQESLTYILLLVILVGIFLFTLYWSVTIPIQNERNGDGEVFRVNWKKYLKMFCIGMSYGVFVAIVFIAWNLSYAYLNLGTFALYLRYLYTLLVGLALPIFFVGVVLSFVNFVNDRTIEKHITSMGITQ